VFFNAFPKTTILYNIERFSAAFSGAMRENKSRFLDFAGWPFVRAKGQPAPLGMTGLGYDGRQEAHRDVRGIPHPLRGFEMTAV